MDKVAGVTTIDPFWAKLSKLYRYPLTTDGAIALVGLGLINAVFYGSLIAIVFTTAAITLYSFTCLHQTANGDFEAPGIEGFISESVGPLVSVIFIMCAALLCIEFINQYLGIGFAVLVTTLFLIALPASIIVIAVEGSLIDALDPSKLMSVIQSTGMGYFVMLIFIFIMYTSILILNSIIYNTQPNFLSFFLGFTVCNYYLVIIFHIMGYLVYQNQENLGFKSSMSNETITVRSPDMLAKANIDVLIKSGAYEKASILARQRIEHPDAALWQWTMAFELSCISASEKDVYVLFNQYAHKLFELKDAEKLCRAYRLLKKHHPKYVSDKASLNLLLAKTLIGENFHKIAFQLLQESNHTFTNDDDKQRALKLIKLSRSNA